MQGFFFFYVFSLAIKLNSLAWLSRCLPLSLKRHHLFLCWWGWEGMRIHASSLAGWLRCFSSRCSCQLPYFCVICYLATLWLFVQACWICGYLAQVMALVEFPGVQVAQTNCWCWSRLLPMVCVCAGALLYCENVCFLGHGLHVSSHLGYFSLK